MNMVPPGSKLFTRYLLSKYTPDAFHTMGVYYWCLSHLLEEFQISNFGFFAILCVYCVIQIRIIDVKYLKSEMDKN